MRYLFSNALKNVLRQKKAYIFFAVQILISFVIMLVFGSLASSLHCEIGEMEKDNTAHSIYLSEVRSEGAREGGHQYYNSTEMTYEDYLWIKENYGDVLSVSFALHTYFHALDNGHPVSFDVLFVTDEYFRNAYENDEMLDFSSQKVILAPEGAERLSNRDDTESSINYHLADFLSLAEKDGYTVNSIDSIYNGKADRVDTYGYMWYGNIEEFSAPLSSVMIAPVELYNKYLAESDEYHNTMLSINFNGETDTDVFNSICTHLVEEKDPKGECVYVSHLSAFEEHAQGQIMMASLLRTISAVATVITGIGFAGLILVIFNNRRKKLAVAEVTGATYWGLYLEIILEIETVILAGVLLGEISGITVMNVLNKQVTVFEFGTDTGLAVLLPVLYAVMGVVISFAALYNLLKMQPNEVLKKE